jgi:hypothetical protein
MVYDVQELIAYVTSYVNQSRLRSIHIALTVVYMLPGY